ncbi:MAG: type II toxin-antitoxin system HicA family toxin [Bryobacteraceae bacterium]|nr:type II toxin-antitoxin system HicA family toxin [Bryobacteraceae bacterium]
MGKLRALSGDEIRRILIDHGFLAVRQRGSHCIVQKRTFDGTISVPIPLHDPVRRGTLLSIIRQSGLPKMLFEAER